MHINYGYHTTHSDQIIRINCTIVLVSNPRFVISYIRASMLLVRGVFPTYGYEWMSRYTGLHSEVICIFDCCSVHYLCTYVSNSMIRSTVSYGNVIGRIGSIFAKNLRSLSQYTTNAYVCANARVKRRQPKTHTFW